MVAYIPVLKVILPYLAPLVEAAAPMFTKKSEPPSQEPSLQEKQISELQGAVQKNAESLQTLAKQLQQSIAAFDERESADQKSFSDLHASLQAAQHQNDALRNALEKSIKDVQVTKYLALAALFASFVGFGYQLLKSY